MKANTQKRIDEVFQRILGMWPDTVSIEDGIPTNEAGMLFKNLSTIHQNLEEGLDKNDGLGQVMVWTLFQHLHSKAMEALKQNIKVIRPKETHLEYILDKYLTNLSVEGWEDEKKYICGD